MGAQYTRRSVESIGMDTRIDKISDTLEIIGTTEAGNYEKTSEKVWKLVLVEDTLIFYGEKNAGNGDYNQIWDNRISIFGL